MGGEEHHCSHYLLHNLLFILRSLTDTEREKETIILSLLNVFTIARVKQIGRLEEGSKEEGILKGK